MSSCSEDSKNVIDETVGASTVEHHSSDDGTTVGIDDTTVSSASEVEERSGVPTGRAQDGAASVPMTTARTIIRICIQPWTLVRHVRYASALAAHMLQGKTLPRLYMIQAKNSLESIDRRMREVRGRTEAEE